MTSCCRVVQGGGGGMQLPVGYLKRVYEMVHARGGVCIADEVSKARFKYTGVWCDLVVVVSALQLK